MNTEKTIFERIIDREIPATIVYEDDFTLAFLDIAPVNIGHTVVIPKKHFKNLYEIDTETLHHIADTVQKVAIALKKALNADGINIEQNNDAPAGQIIFHTHTHVVPRFIGDGFTHWKGARGYSEGEANETAEKIKKLS